MQDTMTHPELIAAMLEAAAPVVRDYWTDLRHDARLIATAEAGSTFLWAPRAAGTFIVLLQRGGRPNVRAAATYAAMSSNDRTVQWHTLSVGQRGECAMTKLDAEDAVLAAWQATRSAEFNPARAVSELHM